MRDIISPLSGIRSPFGGRSLTSPFALFAFGEQGVWFDPSDVANLNWRRNLLLATDAPGSATGVSVTANAATAPDGTNNAARVSKTDSTTPRYTTQTWTSAAGLPNTVYTVSRYVKYDGFNTTVSLEYNSTTTFDLGWIAPFSVTASGVTADAPQLCTSSVQDVGNGWYRIRATFTSGASTSANTTPMLSRITGASGVSVLMYGAQIELGSTATDYQRITDVNTEVIERFPTATLYQDTAGTQPVTTTGQSVGLMLDKSRGLVLGPELVTNGDFGTGDLTGFTSGGGWAVSDGAARLNSNNGAFYLRPTVANTNARWLTFTVVSGSTGSIDVRGTSPAYPVIATFASPGTYTVFIAAGVEINFLRTSATFNGGLDNISVKELPGNHAVQATTANRPIYGIHPFGGRRNLGLMTSMTSVTGTAGSQFPNATGWANFFNTGGTRTYVASSQFPGDQALDISGVTAARNLIGYSFTPLASTTYTVSFWIESFSGVTGTISYVSGTLGTGGTTNIVAAPLSTGRASYTFTTGTSPGTVDIRLGIGTAGNESGSIRISGFQVEVASTATAYQRVTDQYNVTEAGVSSVSYLFFDGVNDSMATSTITPGVDKAQVFAGVRKLSDALAGVLVELSATSASNNGSLILSAPFTSTNAGYGFGSRGTTRVVAEATSGFAAPITNVITGIGDISGDVSRLRANGSQIAADTTTDQGTGNFLAYPLYIGARAGTSLFFSGHLYSLIARFGSNLAAGQISSTETWVAGKTGVVI